MVRSLLVHGAPGRLSSRQSRPIFLCYSNSSDPALPSCSAVRLIPLRRHTNRRQVASGALVEVAAILTAEIVVEPPVRVLPPST